jgi:hypothetical protein
VVRFLCLLACLAAACDDDPPRMDAGIDAPGEFVVLEEISVPVSSGTVPSANELLAGVTYRLRASGTFNAGVDTFGDAEYIGFTTGTPIDTQSGIDIGLAVNDTVVDGARMPKWGAYSDSHVYEVDFVGKGVPIVVQFHDATYGNNTGSLTLTILRRR